MNKQDELKLILTMNYLCLNDFKNKENISLQEFLLKNLATSIPYKDLKHEYRLAIMVYAQTNDINDFDDREDCCENLKRFLIDNNLNFFNEFTNKNAIELI